MKYHKTPLSIGLTSRATYSKMVSNRLKGGTMTTARYTEDQARSIATTIKKQIGFDALASLGASNFYAVDGGLRFMARILPFTKSGERSVRPAEMYVEVTLTAEDLYDLRVCRLQRFNIVEHAEAKGVFAEDLPKLMLALDWDGDEVFNPRFW